MRSQITRLRLSYLTMEMVTTIPREIALRIKIPNLNSDGSDVVKSSPDTKNKDSWDFTDDRNGTGLNDPDKNDTHKDGNSFTDKTI